MFAAIQDLDEFQPLVDVVASDFRVLEVNREN